MKYNYKVSIVVPGKFHAFYLAKQLQNKGLLSSLITSYPKYLVSKENIKKNLVISLFFKEIVERLMIKMKISRILNLCYYYLNLIFEISASKKFDYKKTNIIVGWSASSETIFKKIKLKNNNILKILERGSSHISFQNKILNHEYEKFGIKKNPIDTRIIEKELREYELADYIMVPSEFARESFLSYGIKKDKILKVPYGVDLSLFKRNLNKPKEFTIINAGHISIRKGSYYLLKAFDELNLKDCKLILVGNIEDEIKKIIKPFLNRKKIYFKKHVPQKNLKELYDLSHLFVIPSIEEGMAMVQPQAMAAGLPLICTTNSGGAEIVDDNKNGFISPIRDINFLKNKILYLYENREVLLNFSENAYAKAQKSLSWDEYGNKISRTYQEIICKYYQK